MYRGAARDAWDAIESGNPVDIAMAATGFLPMGAVGKVPKAAGKVFADAGSSLAKGASSVGQPGVRSLSLKEMERQEAAAVLMYDDIRASTIDVQNIVTNTGLKDFQVARVKNHLFYDETHQLRERVGRFDPDYEIAQAWQRMETGRHLPEDIQLFKHEYFESRFEKIFRTDYGTAHNKTQLRYPSPLD